MSETSRSDAPQPDPTPAPAGPVADAAEDEVPEPASATHAAEDETWETDGDDAAHLGARVADLEARVQELQAELDAARDRALRARADYDNLSRRTATERDEQARLAAGRVLERLLEPMEVLQRAAADASSSAEPHAEGIRLAYRGLRTVLEREGLEEVAGVGTPFDPKVHEAVAREPSADVPAGTVAAVVRPGYRVHGRLLRAALVKVSSGPS